MDESSKFTEEQLVELNRALQTLHQCNLALIHAKEEEELLRSICEILMEFGEFRMVWVGYREDDEKKSVRPVAFAGVEDGYLQGLEITWADNERGQGPSGTAVRTGKPSWAKNIREDAKLCAMATICDRAGICVFVVAAIEARRGNIWCAVFVFGGGGEIQRTKF